MAAHVAAGFAYFGKFDIGTHTHTYRALSDVRAKSNPTNGAEEFNMDKGDFLNNSKNISAASAGQRRR